MTIANSGHDENGRYSGGKPGDQTGKEWEIRIWYNRPWICALEPPTEAIGIDLALLATHGANNDLIGYNQLKRTTFYTYLMKAANYDPANIKTACDSDCSAGVAALVIACGKRNGNKKMAAVSKDCYTGNLRQALINAGFKLHTDSKYLTSDAYLGKGWVLLNDQHHTAINLTNGSKYKSSSSMSTSTSTSTTTSSKTYSTGTYKITANPDLNIRTGAGTQYKIVDILVKGAGAKVTEVKKVGNDWWGKITKGWICLELNGKPYVAKASTSTGSSTTTSKKYNTGKYKVITKSGVNVRSGAGTNYKICDKALSNGTVKSVTETKQVGSNWWGKISSGWICLEMNGTPYVSKA